MYRQVLLASAVACTALTRCSSSSSSGGSGTTGKNVILHTRVVIQDDLTQPKTNSLGWAVTVTRAYLSIGPLYFFAGDPLISSLVGAPRPTPGRWTRLLDWLEPPAYAHPGHYIQGDAMGQWVLPTAIDLLGGNVPLGDGTGVTGAVNSARFTWQSPPAGVLAPQLEGHVVFTAGIATKGNSAVRFVAKADVGDVLDGDGQPKVDGCTFGPVAGKDGVTVDGDGTVTLTLVPTVWFDQVDFAYALPGIHADAALADDADADAEGASPDGGGGIVDAPPGSPVEAGPPDAESPADAGPTGEAVDIAGTLAWQGFLRGVKKGTGYLFSYSK